MGKRINHKEVSKKYEDSAYNEHTSLIVTGDTDATASLEEAKRLLYFSHFTATFVELGWQFCLILFLTALTNFKSFTLVASYGLFSGLVVSLSGPSAGSLIDNSQRNRLEIAQLFIWIQNISVLIATICCFFLLRSVDKKGMQLESSWIPDLAPPATMTTWTLIIIVHIFGAIGKLSDQSMSVALERDWIVVMSKVAVQDSEINEKDSEKKEWLSQTNTVMKQIDLACKVAAPAAAGMFFAYFDNDGGYQVNNAQTVTQWLNLAFAAIIIGMLNLFSLFIEIFIIGYIYKLVPLLAIRKNRHMNRVSNSSIEYHRRFAFLPRGLDLYLQQPISFAGIGAAILYLNVLSFGTIMTAYLVFRGMSYESIGMLRGISSTIGIIGTFAYRISSKQYNLAFIGASSITFQFLCLSLSFASMYIPNDRVSLNLLIVGVIASRIGLYSFKLTITQLMQQMIPEDIRGIIGGVQKSLNGLFDLATYGLGLIFAKPEEFNFLVTTGFTSVGITLCLYIWGIRKHEILLETSC